MGIIGGKAGYLVLQNIAPKNSVSVQMNDEDNRPNLPLYFGKDIYKLIQGKSIIDFGCGKGIQAVEIARNGAAKVTGIDIQERWLVAGRKLAAQNAVSDRCIFTTETKEKADIILSKDAFEHFADPSAILRIMYQLLKPDGFILAAFGRTWLHPYGGHTFSAFPWAHLIFTEKALVRWRSDFKSDGATKFAEVEGGLNQLTIHKFRRIVKQSPCRLEWLETIPIKGISLFKFKPFQEIGSAIVRCKLVAREAQNGTGL